MRALLYTTSLVMCILFACLIATPTFAQDGTVEVTATGSGASKGAALTAAYAEAVRQAIAQAVDPDTAARNEQTIQNDILPRSRGYIKQARAAGDSESGGIHSVTINATVDIALLKEKLATDVAAAPPTAPTAAPAPAAPQAPPVATQAPTPAQPAPAPVVTQPSQPAQAPQPEPQVAQVQPAQEALPWQQEQPQPQPQQAPQQQAQQAQPMQQPQAVPPSPTAKDTEETLRVVAVGFGLDEDSAMRSAYSNAIQQALGMYVDAETLVSNDELVKDQILTHSRGFIKQVETVSKGVDNGIFTVKIIATIDKMPLIEKAKPLMQTVAQVDGTSLHAQIVTQVEQTKSAEALFDEAIKPFLGYDLFKFTVTEHKYDQENSNLIVTVRAEPNMPEYEKARAKLIEVLDQISLESKEYTHTDIDTKNIYEHMDKFCNWRGSENRPGNFVVNTMQFNNYNMSKWKSYTVPDVISNKFRNLDVGFHIDVREHVKIIPESYIEVQLFDSIGSIVSIGAQKILDRDLGYLYSYGIYKNRHIRPMEYISPMILFPSIYELYASHVSEDFHDHVDYNILLPIKDMDSIQNIEKFVVTITN